VKRKAHGQVLSEGIDSGLGHGKEGSIRSGTSRDEASRLALGADAVKWSTGGGKCVHGALVVGLASKKNPGAQIGFKRERIHEGKKDESWGILAWLEMAVGLKC
jgi:hypothetical protein